MVTWKISYIDKLSNGRVNTTTHTGCLTRQEVIEFFGLDKPDVLWFKIEIVKTENNGRKENNH